MKKIYLFLLAAAGILAAASCTREELAEPVAPNPDEVTTITFSLESTKTALVDGKTTWQAGDKIRVYNSNAKFSQDVEIPEDAIGQASFSVDINMKDTAFYAVYPVEAANGLSDGKVSVVLPSNPDGRFASANICAAEVHNGTTLQFRNVTAILKINIQSGNVIEILQFNAKNNMNGTFKVDLSGEDPVLEEVSGGKSATVAVGALDGDYYVPVAPGSYTKEFSVTALRGNGGYQTKTTTEDNDVEINKLFDLGVIGDNLSSGLSGEGTEASPYLIKNLGEYSAFSASVTLGNPYEDKYVSLETDVTEGVNAPVGYYISDDEQAAFAGHFLGNNHTITVDLDGENCKSQNYVALFGILDAGGSISDLKVTGSANATGNYTAGVVAYVRGSSSNKASVTNCTSEVAVASTGDRVGGVAGYAGQADIVNCVNGGTVDGKNCVAGIVAYAYYVNVENCRNNAAVTSNATSSTGVLSVASGTSYFTNGGNDFNNGTGGVAGWAQNSTIKDCSNSGNVTGFTKVGGVAGVCYWTSLDNGTNSGNVKGTGYYEDNVSSQMGTVAGSCTGGVVGYQLVSGTVSNSTNTGNVSGYNGIGGVTGIMTSSQGAAPHLRNCTNSGTVTAVFDPEVGVPNNGNTASMFKNFPRGVGGFNAGVGGIVGSMIGFRYDVTAMPSVRVCVNKKSATVNSRFPNVGGIVGLAYDAGNSQAPGWKYIEDCVNEADVTGYPYRIGGILGYSFSRYAGRTIVRNCANHGTITGARDVNGGTVVGGIAGGVGSNVANYRSSTAGHLNVYNCYNDGDVVYSVSALTDPYVGGIVGYLWGNSNFQNNYNIAYVGPADKTATPATGALGYIGALCGNQFASYVHFSFYLAGLVNGQAVGTAGTAARTDTVCTFDEEGNLAQPITANYVDCTTLIDALNQWQNYYATVGYFNWTGPAGHPVFDTTKD